MEITNIGYAAFALLILVTMIIGFGKEEIDEQTDN
jgi:hypothetical protein